MLKIRLQRVGRKHEPSFRVVLTDSKNSTKSGRFAEVLGSYDPRKLADSLKADRIKHWLSQGARPTETVQNILIKHGVIRGKKAHVGADYVAPSAPAEPSPAKQEAVVSEEQSTETSAETPAA